MVYNSHIIVKNKKTMPCMKVKIANVIFRNLPEHTPKPIGEKTLPNREYATKNTG